MELNCTSIAFCCCDPHNYTSFRITAWLGWKQPPSLFSHSVLTSGIAPSPKYNTLSLLNLPRFLRAHFLSLSRSLWVASLPCLISTSLVSLVSSVKLLGTHFIPLSRLLIKSISPKMDHRGMPFITGFHLNTDPLTTTLFLQPSNQFFIHCIVQPSNFSLSNFEGSCVRPCTGRQHR